MESGSQPELHPTASNHEEFILPVISSPFSEQSIALFRMVAASLPGKDQRRPEVPTSDFEIRTRWIGSILWSGFASGGTRRGVFAPRFLDPNLKAQKRENMPKDKDVTQNKKKQAWKRQG